MIEHFSSPRKPIKNTFLLAFPLAAAFTLPLALFPPGQDYRDFLIEELIRQADREMQQNPGIYFEDYRSLIAKNFNEESYYLTPSGLAVYYQQYEIAPYATGIVVFTIPYETLKWRPSCSAPSPSPYPGRRS